MSEGSSKYQILLTASDKTREAFDSVKNSTNTLHEDLNVVAGAFGAVALTAAAALSVMVKNSIDTADATNKAAQKVGLTTEAFSALAYAADLSDVSSDQLQKGLIKLASSAYTAATAGGETADTFRKLGVNVKNADGSLKDSGTLLSELSAKFAAMPEGIEKSAMAVKVFGEKLGGSMLPLLNSGADGLARMGEEALKTGNIISSDTAKQAEAFNDNLTRLKKASEGFSNEIMSHLLPGLTKTTEAMVALSQEGHPVLAMLRGFAGAGQAFWDFLIPPENLKKALAPDGMLDEATRQLKKLQHEKNSIEGSGFGLINTDKIDREITILQNQIATIKNHRAELAQPTKTDKPVSTTGGLDNEEAKKSMDAMLANAQKFADELVVSHQSAFDKIVTKYVEMDEKLSKAGAAGAETRKQVQRSFEAFMVDEQQKRTDAIQAAADKETEANNKLIETQQEKFARMREIADQASTTGEERENARYKAQMDNLDNEKQVLDDKNLWSLELDAKYWAAKEALQKEHNARSSQVSRTYGVSLVQFEAQTAMQRTQTMAAGLAQMTAVGAQKHRALFEINKVAGIANAVIQGVEAVQSSYKFGATWGGPAGGAAMAAIAIAATAANIEAIRSTEFGGGAPNVGGGGVPSMAVSPGVPVAPQPGDSSNGNQQQSQPIQVNIYNTGNVLSADYVENTIIPQIRDSVSNSDVLIIDPRSRQAQVLVPT